MMGLRRLDAGDIGFGRWQHPLRPIAVVVNRAATGTPPTDCHTGLSGWIGCANDFTGDCS
jgi:hypothetical protein